MREREDTKKTRLKFSLFEREIYIFFSSFVAHFVCVKRQTSERKPGVFCYCAFVSLFNEKWKMNFVYLSMFAVEFVRVFVSVEDIRHNHVVIDDIYRE